MKLANVSGNPALLVADGFLDLTVLENGRYANFADIYAGWDDFRRWVDTIDTESGVLPLNNYAALGPPSPAPAQIFGVGYNYGAHIKETGTVQAEDFPPFFTKFPSSLIGPGEPIEIVSTSVDYEVELVVVIGKHADRVPEGKGWDYVAGLTAGQDISARNVQRGGNLSLGKSFRGFTVVGPILVTPEEFEDRNDIALRSWVNDDLRQDGRTSELILDVSELIELISAVTPLIPGDLLFTGTPAGVGARRNPPEFLVAGDTVRTYVEGIGEFINPCIEHLVGEGVGRRWSDVVLKTNQ